MAEPLFLNNSISSIKTEMITIITKKSMKAKYAFKIIAVIIVIISVLMLLIELFRNKGSAIVNLGSLLLGIFYIGLFSSTLVLIREHFAYSDFLYSEGGYLIISLMVTIWICDSAAFFIGSAFGRHKLFPRVSPNKSWEGAAAGFIFSVITMIAANSLVLDTIDLFDSVVIGLIIGIFGQVGDLIESLIKRDASVKDSSKLIPGHGGIFDRFDSLLFTSPIVYVYLYFIT
jgi:phosphatidate cytidylyltransferase